MKFKNLALAIACMALMVVAHTMWHREAHGAELITGRVIAKAIRPLVEGDIGPPAGHLYLLQLRTGVGLAVLCNVTLSTWADTPIGSTHTCDGETY